MRLEDQRGILEQIALSSILTTGPRLRDNESGIQELAMSIMTKGLIEPIVVRPKNDKFELVAGSRRLAAFRLLGRRRISCQIMELSDRESFEIALAENVARSTLNPLEEARSFQLYIQKFGRGSAKELAKIVGKSSVYVSRRLKLLELPSKDLESMFQRGASPSLVEELVAIPENELQEDLMQLSTELSLSSKEVRKLGRSSKSSMARTELDEMSDSWANREKDSMIKRRSIERIILALRVALYRLDEVITNLDTKDWILYEVLMEQRSALHAQIDLVLNLTKKLDKLPNKHPKS